MEERTAEGEGANGAAAAEADDEAEEEEPARRLKAPTARPLGQRSGGVYLITERAIWVMHAAA